MIGIRACSEGLEIGCGPGVFPFAKLEGNNLTGESLEDAADSAGEVQNWAVWPIRPPAPGR